MTTCESHELLWTLRGRAVLALSGLTGAVATTTANADTLTTLLLLAVLFALPLLVQYLARTRDLGTLEIAVAPRRTIAGAAYAETLVLRAPERRSPLVALEISEPRARKTGAPTRLAELPGDTPTEITLLCRSRTRGAVQHRVFAVESTFPFGLLRTRVLLRTEATLITEPARLELPTQLLQATLAADAAPIGVDHGEGREFHSLREHASEEDARRVHALRSAALGTLVRRVERGHAPRELALVLDLRRPPGRSTALGRAQLEWKLSACATLLDVLHARGSDVYACVIDEGQRTLHTSEPGVRAEFGRILAAAEPVPHRSLHSGPLWTLDGCARCLWIAAGGHVDHAAIDELGVETTLVEHAIWG